eukprot:8256209-Lingulodinium_polyedra.AAC.1
MPREVVWEYVRGVVRGIKHLHNLGVCHGDLSLRNLFVTQDGRVQIGDFGTVCAAGRFLLEPEEEVA